MLQKYCKRNFRYSSSIMFRHVKKLHFVGIGGIGMSGIAELLLNQGFKISGSDINDSKVIQNLKTKVQKFLKDMIAKIYRMLMC